MAKHQHALTRAHYEAEGPNRVRVVDGDKWGLFDRFGNWLEGELIQCDPHICIWLTGIVIVNERGTATVGRSNAGETQTDQTQTDKQ